MDGLWKHCAESKKQKTTYCMPPFIWNIWIWHSTWTEVDEWLPKVGREGYEDWLFNGYRVSFHSDEMFWNYIIVIVEQHCKHTNATEWYTLRWLRWWTLCYVNFTAHTQESIYKVELWKLRKLTEFPSSLQQVLLTVYHSYEFLES